MAATGSAFQGFHHHHHLPSLGTNGGAVSGGEKVKFTVSVRGHQWSSARHVHETLQEFARVIERNARRLEFIGQGDCIQRLQLVRPDGSEPEELDVDATLEDVLICMGEKQLVAIITPTKDVLLQNTALATGDRKPPSPCVLEMQQKTNLTSFFPKNETPSIYSLTPTSAPTADNESPTPGCSKSSPPSYGVRGLKISIPSCEYTSPSAFPEETKGHHQTSGVASINNLTPSPAELAQFLIRGASNRQKVNGGNSRFGHCSSAAPAVVPVFPFQSPFAGNRPFQANASACAAAQGAPNIALLAQFLAAQLKAFTPSQGNPPEPSGKNTVNNDQNANAAAAAHHHRVSAAARTSSEAAAGGPETNSVKIDSHDDKDASSSSANINNPGFPSSFGHTDNNDSDKGRSELVFLVNRRSKLGVGTHHLKLSDLSAYFHLSIVDAAKKLGVSQTTLKKACRKFGLKRWPGRKVRSLESTIHGLEHTIAVGQGAGMEDLTEAYMRSEVLKLQQEMDQLVHGVPTAQQHLPMVRTADLYKRLYSRGWRSKFHSPCGRFDIDLNSISKEEENKSSSAQEPEWKTGQEEAEKNNNRSIHQHSETAEARCIECVEDEDEQQAMVNERVPKKPKVEEPKQEL